MPSEKHKLEKEKFFDIGPPKTKALLVNKIRYILIKADIEFPKMSNKEELVKIAKRKKYAYQKVECKHLNEGCVGKPKGVLQVDF